LRLYLSTADREVSRETFARGAYERALFSRVMDELMRVGMPGGGLKGRGFLDVGANIGSATCLALIRYGAGEAWVFEPAPENVTDHEGAVAFELSDKSCGDHRVRVEHASNDGPPALLGETQRRTVEVHARRLDSLVDESAIDLGSLGLAWIDVQGHEGHVLEGAAELLASGVPIVCEYWPYGLERAGGLERFHTLVAGSRSGFIDLATPGAMVHPTARLSALRAHYPRVASTDLLLLR
jgi:FkbM family methyltransferase